jgi:hypothetical protein
MTKKGYFFTLDAMLSLGILVLGSLLLLASFTSVPSTTQTSVLADSVMDFLTLTKIKEFNNPHGGIGGVLWNQGKITNEDNTLLQQIGEFYYKNELVIAEEFILNSTENLIPGQFSFEFWIDDLLLYPSSPSQTHLDSKATTKILLPTKKITYGILNESADFFGPYDVEVLLWE